MESYSWVAAMSALDRLVGTVLSYLNCAYIAHLDRTIYREQALWGVS